MTKEKNGLDNLVEMFEEADCIFLSDLTKEGLVCAEPCESKTGRTWSMMLLTGIDEAKTCKCKVCCRADDKKLCKWLSKNRKK